MNLEIPLWLQEEIERFTIESVKKERELHYPVEKFYLEIKIIDISYGVITVEWKAFSSTIDSPYNCKIGEIYISIRKAVRDFLLEDK